MKCETRNVWLLSLAFLISEAKTTEHKLNWGTNCTKQNTWTAHFYETRSDFLQIWSSKGSKLEAQRHHSQRWKHIGKYKILCTRFDENGFWFRSDFLSCTWEDDFCQPKLLELLVFCVLKVKMRRIAASKENQEINRSQRGILFQPTQLYIYEYNARLHSDAITVWSFVEISSQLEAVGTKKLSRKSFNPMTSSSARSCIERKKIETK